MLDKPSIQVRFLPEDVTVSCPSGELLLDCAARAGIRIPTGCQMGSCHACEVEIEGRGPVCACITSVRGVTEMIVTLANDPIW